MGGVWGQPVTYRYPPMANPYQVGRLEITVGAGLSERRYRGVHQAGRVRGQAFVAQTQRIHVARRGGLQHYVGGDGELAQRGRALRRVDVQRYAALVGVEVEPVQAAAGAGLAADERADVAHGVAAGRFNLDDVGAQVGQQLAAIDAHGAGQVEGAVAGERLGRRGI